MKIYTTWKVTAAEFASGSAAVCWPSASFEISMQTTPTTKQYADFRILENWEKKRFIWRFYWARSEMQQQDQRTRHTATALFFSALLHYIPPFEDKMHRLSTSTRWVYWDHSNIMLSHRNPRHNVVLVTSKTRLLVPTCSASALTLNSRKRHSPAVVPERYNAGSLARVVEVRLVSEWVLMLTSKLTVWE